MSQDPEEKIVKNENSEAEAEPVYETDAELAADDNHGADLDDSVVSEEVAQATIKKLRTSLKKALAEKQEYLTGWQKDKAEFVNARKRDENSQKEFIKFSN